jgi:S1-C subfamily serine protease
MALLPPVYLDSVVAIGVVNADRSKTWIGTGFLVGRFHHKIDDEKNYYDLFLVTNKHVLQSQKSIVVRFNPEPSTGSAALDFPIELIDKDNKIIWEGHPKQDIDVAVISINTSILRQHLRKFEFFRTDSNLLRIKDMIEKGVSEGDFVYALGFPMNLVDADRQYVISRAGTIARIRDVLEGYRNDFILDMSIFPGNSGSPIVTKPEFIHIDGTKSLARSYLIGIVKAIIPYEDVAVSQQTKQIRVVFQENSGLAMGIPVDFIIETIDLCYEKVFPETKAEAEATV